MSNLCRDESCMILEDKIESVFGSCFSTHGLGGVLTCGVIGMGAGLSHSPVENVSVCHPCLRSSLESWGCSTLPSPGALPTGGCDQPTPWSARPTGQPQPAQHTDTDTTATTLVAPALNLVCLLPCLPSVP